MEEAKQANYYAHNQHVKFQNISSHSIARLQLLATASIFYCHQSKYITKMKNPNKKGKERNIHSIWNYIVLTSFCFLMVFLSKPKQSIQSKLILPLPYFETHRSDNIIVGIECLVKNCNGIGFCEVGEEKIDTIQVRVRFPSFVFPLDAIGQRNDPSVEYLHIHATPSNKQLENQHN